MHYKFTFDDDSVKLILRSLAAYGAQGNAHIVGLTNVLELQICQNYLEQRRGREAQKHEIPGFAQYQKLLTERTGPWTTVSVRNAEPVFTDADKKLLAGLKISI
jgi:hypothetical protein